MATPRAPVPSSNPAPAPVEVSPASALKKVAGGLATPNRQRNAAAMIAGLIFIIIAGAIAASVAASFDDSIDVLVAERDIQEGESISSGDFRVVQIAAAAGDIEVLAPDSLDQLVGRVAAGPIGKGSMIHPDQFATPFGEQKILVGAALKPNRFPAGGMQSGDMVRLIALTGSSSSSGGVFGGGGNDDGFRTGQEIAIGELVDVIPLNGDTIHFSIRVPESSANVVVQLVSTDSIALGLLDESVTIDDVGPGEAGDSVEPQRVEEAGE